MSNYLSGKIPDHNFNRPSSGKFVMVCIAALFVVATAFFIVIHSFQSIGSQLNNDLQDHIRLISYNSQMSRRLLYNQLNIHELLSDFTGDPTLAKDRMESYLAEIDELLAQTSQDTLILGSHKRVTLLENYRRHAVALFGDLQTIYAQNVDINALQVQFTDQINAMLQIGTTEDNQSRQSAPSFKKQLRQAKILLLQTRLLMQSSTFSAWLRLPSEKNRRDLPDSAVALAAAFTKKITDITEIPAEHRPGISGLRASLPAYENAVDQLMKNIESLHLHHKQLDSLKNPLLSVLENIDSRSGKAVYRINRNTNNLLSRSATLIYVIFAVLVMLSILGWLLIRMRSIQMITATRETIEAKKELERKNNELQNEITERSMVTTALRLSEERYRDLFENATDMIQILSPEGKILYANRAWRETLGYTQEELPHISIFDLIHPDCRKHCMTSFENMMNTGENIKIDTTLIAKDGRRIQVEGTANLKFEDGKPVSSRCILRDVTEQRKMQDEIFTAKKIESIGILAGGIAHDFNNLLTAILGNVSLAKLYIDSSNKAYQKLNLMEKASVKAKHLTQQLLTFSKGGTPVTDVASIAELTREAAKFTLSGSTIKCVFDLPDNLLAVEVDHGQIGQVIQNMVTNAAQSMPDGGTIRVTAKNTYISENSGLPVRKTGQYVQLSIQDEGSGICPDHLEKIFDPYFTTKDSGSGLGLAICYSIINKHGGHISFESEMGHGTTFHLYLPVSDKIAIPVLASDEEIIVGDGRILVMDDEQFIREVADEMLSLMGYDVELARDGQEAVDLYRQARDSKNPFDVVLMDLTIPGGMGGKEALAILRDFDPDVKAIVASGYAHDPIMSDYRAHGFCAAITKPFKIQTLGRILYSVL